MDENELKKELEALKTKLESKENEITRILAKNQELLDETKAAKAAKRESDNKFSGLTSQFDELKQKVEHGDKTMDKVNELVAQKLERKQAEFDERLETLMNEKNASDKALSSLKSKYDNERISSALRRSAEKAGVIPEAIDDVVLRANGVFSVSDDGTIEARDSDGNLRKSGKKALSPDVFVEDLKETAGHFWPASQGSGAAGNKSSGKFNGPNPFSKKTRNFTEQSRLRKVDPELANKLQKEAESEAA